MEAFRDEESCMSMRAIRETGIGENLSPPLLPLASVLDDNVLKTHCSACFGTLPPNPISRLAGTDTLTLSPLYCSIHCCAADADLYSHSGELYILRRFDNRRPPEFASSSELRLSLRLIRVFEKHPPVQGFWPQLSYLGGDSNHLIQENERIVDLKTNRRSLLKKGPVSDAGFLQDSKRQKWIREGAKLIGMARGKVANAGYFAFEEMLLCLVMTNAVQVKLRNGHGLGLAVYDTAFSWINHSCCPNSCHWFVLGQGDDQQLPRRASPAGGGVSGRNGYGPRVVVRSVKAIKRGDEVTITYTDLLRPKEMRLEELLRRFRFHCKCKRCCDPPTRSVDHLLQVLFSGNPDIKSVYDNAINEYQSGKAELCCQNLETLLSRYVVSSMSLIAHRYERVVTHPFHHVAMDAYATLARVYKHRADSGANRVEALDMWKTSCAYSLLHVGVVNKLYTVETAFVMSAANVWIDAGESLLNLAISSLWDGVFPRLSRLLPLRCGAGCFISLEPNADRLHRSMTMEDRKRQLFQCISFLASVVWSFLSSESSFLRNIQNPVDLWWLGSTPPAAPFRTESHLPVRMNLYMLSVHCLLYGSLLASICYGVPVEEHFCSLVDAIMRRRLDHQD